MGSSFNGLPQFLLLGNIRQRNTSQGVLWVPGIVWLVTIMQWPPNFPRVMGLIHLSWDNDHLMKICQKHWLVIAYLCPSCCPPLSGVRFSGVYIFPVFLLKCSCQQYFLMSMNSFLFFDVCFYFILFLINEHNIPSDFSEKKKDAWN